MPENVLVKCFTCRGTGLIKAMPAEIRLGETCSICGGSGSLPMELFNGRVAVDDIDVVAVSAVTHHRYPQGSISYKDFRAGKIPEIMPNSIKEDGEMGERVNRPRVEKILDGREQGESTLELNRALP